MSAIPPCCLRLAAALVAGITLIPGAVLAGNDAGRSAEEISRRAAAVLEHPSYQKSLVDREASRQGRGRGSTAAAGGDSRQSADAPTRRDRGAWGEGTSRPDRLPEGGSLDPRPAATGIKVVLWLLIGLVVAAAIAWLLREAAASHLRNVRIDEPLVLPQVAAIPEPPGEDEIETLVRQQAYGEAVHLLLGRAITLLGKRRPLAESLTSREVLRATELAEPARGALGVLVAAVERFLFGGVALLREDYERCAEAYGQVIGPSATLAGVAEDSG